MIPIVSDFLNTRPPAGRSEMTPFASTPGTAMAATAATAREVVRNRQIVDVFIVASTRTFVQTASN